MPVERDDDDPPGYHPGYARVGTLLGAERIGLSVYELPTGDSICPYHYEYGAEEWLLVVSGRPTLRHPEGEDELEPGDVVCFPEGPLGAHKVTNRGEGLVRVAMLSTKHDPAIAVYPDSDKVGVFGTGDDRGLFQRASTVDFWEGELG